jgi:transposase-like protein
MSKELMATRGSSLTSEAVRSWCRTFGQADAHELRHRPPSPGDKWYVDEGFLTIRGERHHLWPAGAQDGNIRDILLPQHALRVLHDGLQEQIRRDQESLINQRLRALAPELRRAHA